MKKIYMSGTIGWDVWPDNVRNMLDDAAGEDVDVIISSQGGLVGDGLEIHNMLRNYSGKVRVTMAGYCMSIATYIALAADEVVVEDNAVYMIHNVHGGIWGDHNDILHYGEMCKGLSSMLTRAYAKFTDKGVDDLAKLMDATTYYYGDEIVDQGFAHGLVESDGESDGDENNRETALAKAQLTHQELTAKMTSDQEALKKDLNRASALALGSINRVQSPAASAAAKPTTQQGDNMTPEELKKKFPEAVALIIANAMAGNEDAVKAAKTEGAETERARIQACHSQSFPGFEDVVTAAMFDGTSGAGDVAMAINQANLKAQQQGGHDMSGDAPAAAAEPINSGNLPDKKDTPKTEEQAKAKFEKDTALQEEFFSFENYWAYTNSGDKFKVKNR
jgi:ATP-dependent protease ClpP protease subunit